MDCIELGEIIKQKRIEKNLTQKGLAMKLNVTDKAVSKWERGLCYPDLSLYEMLSAVLDIPLENLISHKGLELKQNISTTSENKIKFLVFTIIYMILGILLYFLSLLYPDIVFFIKRIYRILICTVYFGGLGICLLKLGGNFHVKKI